MKLRAVNGNTLATLREGDRLLMLAVGHLKAAGAVKAAQAARRARWSAQGAIRHAERIISRTIREERNGDR